MKLFKVQLFLILAAVFLDCLLQVVGNNIGDIFDLKKNHLLTLGLLSKVLKSGNSARRTHVRHTVMPTYRQQPVHRQPQRHSLHQLQTYDASPHYVSNNDPSQSYNEYPSLPYSPPSHHYSQPHISPIHPQSQAYSPPQHTSSLPLQPDVQQQIEQYPEERYHPPLYQNEGVYHNAHPYPQPQPQPQLLVRQPVEHYPEERHYPSLYQHSGVHHNVQSYPQPQPPQLPQQHQPMQYQLQHYSQPRHHTPLHQHSGLYRNPQPYPRTQSHISPHQHQPIQYQLHDNSQPPRHYPALHQYPVIHHPVHPHSQSGHHPSSYQYPRVHPHLKSYPRSPQYSTLKQNPPIHYQLQPYSQPHRHLPVQQHLVVHEHLSPHHTQTFLPQSQLPSAPYHQPRHRHPSLQRRVPVDYQYQPYSKPRQYLTSQPHLRIPHHMQPYPQS